MSIPSITTAAANLVGGAIDKAAPLVNTAANAATASQTNQSEFKVGNKDSYPLALEATKDLAPGKEGANQGIAQAAQIEKDIGVPVGQAVKQEGGLGVQQSANVMKDNAQKVYEESVQKTHDATIAAETALKSAAENAKIDPQGYLNSLGTTDKVLTSIGMVLSGMGAGMTGQPNLAVELYNKNTDRAIEAQKAKYQNMMMAAASAQGLLRTAQDRQAISSLAYQSAVMSVMQGNNAAIQGAGMQIKSAAAPELIKQMQYENDLKFQQANDAFAKSYINTMQSGDARQKNLLGAALVPVAESLTGDDSFKFGRGNAGQRASVGGSGRTEPTSTGSFSMDNPGEGVSIGQAPGSGSEAPTSPLAELLGGSFSDDTEQLQAEKAYAKWKDASFLDKLTGPADKKAFLEKYGGK